MSNLLVKDGGASSKYIKGTGAGSDADPFIAEHLLSTGTNLVGAINMRRTAFSFAKTLTTVNGATTAKDVVGGLITITGAARANAGMGVIKTVVLGGVSALVYDLWFLNADIATPALDGAAFTIVAADEAKVVGVMNIAAAKYFAPQSAFNVATVNDVNIYYKTGASTTSLYAYMVADATTTPATTTLYLNIAGEFLD